MESILIERFATEYIQVDARKCRACWRCIGACPENVIGRVGLLWHKHIVIKDPENCKGCMKCLKVCPHGAFTNP